MSATMAGRRDVVKSGSAQWVLALGCVVLLAAKFWLISRLNINWDEFYFLSHVHSESRDELTQALQTGYTHLFAWLPGVTGGEVAQIRVARIVMVTLLGLSVWLIQRLASRWFSLSAAWAAALAFLAMWPTMKHGGSFRADSLLLPLQLGALVLLTEPRLGERGRGLGAGVLLGMASVVSIKAILFAPVVLLVGFGAPIDWRRGIQRLAWLSVAALVTGTLLLGAHLLSVSGQDAVAATGAVAEGAWQKTLRDTPWLPQVTTLWVMLKEDWIMWVLAAVGLGCALWRRLWPVAACSLALLPILFYRNSFAYYYVVMWGPAAILISAAFSAVDEKVRAISRPRVASALVFAVAVFLVGQGLRDLPLLSHPRQTAQAQLVAAIHTVFPEPVPYIDHSGMIASFRKANFFMSTWGVERYLSRGQPFMPRAMERFRPPLLVSNRAELVPGTGSYAMLLAEDRRSIEAYYQPYWGPIRIAGGVVELSGPKSMRLELPFPGSYRLESSRVVQIDGIPHHPDDVIHVSAEGLIKEVADPSLSDVGVPLTVRLLWADARPPPAASPVSLNYYDPL